jgi:hypothetical protein
MNAEEAWRTWWEAEGKHMERLLHHDAVDHMASVNRIAWLNGAFGATEEIDRLRQQRDDARRACKAWESNLAEPQEIDPADLQALMDAAWKDDRLTVMMSARDLWRMASDRRGREEE